MIGRSLPYMIHYCALILASASSVHQHTIETLAVHSLVVSTNE